MLSTLTAEQKAFNKIYNICIIIFMENNTWFYISKDLWKLP